jgi:hypothetical protein
MWLTVIKYLLSALVIVVVSEVAKRSGWLGGLIASLPLVSILSFIWVYLDTKNTKTIIDLSYGVFWFIIPSLVLFIVLPILLKRQIPFFGALAIASGVTMVTYIGFAFIFQKMGIKL